MQFVKELKSIPDKNVISNRSCKNCGYRNGTIKHGECMLSGFHCIVERMFPTICGRNFENWIPCQKTKGLKNWLLSLWYN